MLQKFGSQAPNKQEMNNIHLWVSLLQWASTDGIDINHITFTKPIDTTISCICEHEVGDYNLEMLAWQYELPQSLIGKKSIDLLEFIASVITTYLHG